MHDNQLQLGFLSLLGLFFGLHLQYSSQDLSADTLRDLIYKSDTTSQFLVICDLCADPADNVVLESLASFHALAWYDICPRDFSRKILSVDANDGNIIDLFVCDEVSFQFCWRYLKALRKFTLV